jgi:hypothetical protein
MTIIVCKCVRVCEPNSNNLVKSKIKLEFIYICLSGNSFAPMCTILTLDIASVLSSKLIFSEN